MLSSRLTRPWIIIRIGLLAPSLTSKVEFTESGAFSTLTQDVHQENRPILKKSDQVSNTRTCSTVGFEPSNLPGFFDGSDLAA